VAKDPLVLHHCLGVDGGEGCGASLPVGSRNVNEASVRLAQWEPVSSPPQGWSGNDNTGVHVSILWGTCWVVDPILLGLISCQMLVVEGGEKWGQVQEQ
jgi:hypothetical protein